MNALTSEMDGYYCITAKEAIHINLTCVVIAAWFKPPRRRHNASNPEGFAVGFYMGHDLRHDALPGLQASAKGRW